MAQKTFVPKPPIHVLGSVLTIVLDLLWAFPEFGVVAIDMPRFTFLAMISLIVILGIICFLGVFLVQKFVEGDNLGASLTKGFVMGIVAAVPYPVMGTIVGILLLTWAGIHGAEKFVRKLGN